MSDGDEGDEAWALEADDRARLSRLKAAVWKLTPLAKSGGDLIGLGEALEAMECLQRGEPVEVNVGLTIGFRRGDDGFEEGLFVCFRINNEEVELWELNTTYSKEIGSDRSSRVYAALTSDQRFDEVGFEDWLSLLEEVQQDADTRLSTERDHL